MFPFWKKNLSQYELLRDKWVTRHHEIQKAFLSRHKKSIRSILQTSKEMTLGGMAGMLLLSTPVVLELPQNSVLQEQQAEFESVDKSLFLVADLERVLPKDYRVLNGNQENVIEDILNREFGIKVKAELENKRLERTFGYIGAEQHLMRYPGDTIDTHFESQEDYSKFLSSGMAPGRGAFGYFARSRAEMTQQDVLEEKYYIAVQTFRADGYNQRTREYVDFFKYRKMLVVNPKNGKAIVVVIGDAGPGISTGKHLGGSPEVMRYLESKDGKLRDAVLFFFLDDPDNKVALGPLEQKL